MMAKSSVLDRSNETRICGGYTKRRPAEVGFYFFQSSENSPKEFERFVDHVVQVGCDEDANVYGVRISGKSYTVKEMGGFFAGPLIPPSLDF